MDYEDLHNLRRIVVGILVFTTMLLMLAAMSHTIRRSTENANIKFEESVNKKPSSSTTIPKENVTITYTPND